MKNALSVRHVIIGVLVIGIVGWICGCGGGSSGVSDDGFTLQMVDSGTDGAGVVQTATAVVPSAGSQGVPEGAIALRVTIGQIRVIPVGAPPIRLDMPEDTVIDILNLGSWSLLEEDLPPGDYEKLELIVASAEIDLGSEGVLPVVVPSGAQTGLKLPIEFSISDGYNTVLQLDWNTDNSLHCTGNGQWMLQPMCLIVTAIDYPETVDTVTVTATSLAPTEDVLAGQTHVPMLQLDFTVDNNFASIEALDVTLLGTGAVADVDAVEVWVDGGDGVFNPDDTLLTDDVSIGIPPPPLTGTQCPMDASPKTVDITDQQFSFGGTLTLFISYDIAVAASPGTVGASIAVASDISSPDDITGAFPLESGLATIPEPPAP